MKSKHRRKSFRLWRSGQPGLRLAQETVDKLLAANKENPELLPFFLDLKLKVSKEVRDNAAFELKERRESLELADLEKASKLKLTLLDRFSAAIEGQLKRLTSLDELATVLGIPPQGHLGAPSGPAEGPDNGDKPIDVLPESTGESEMIVLGPEVEAPIQNEGSSESLPEAPGCRSFNQRLIEKQRREQDAQATGTVQGPEQDEEEETEETKQ